MLTGGADRVAGGGTSRRCRGWWGLRLRRDRCRLGRGGTVVASLWGRGCRRSLRGRRWGGCALAGGGHGEGPPDLDVVGVGEPLPARFGPALVGVPHGAP